MRGRAAVLGASGSDGCRQVSTPTTYTVVVAPLPAHNSPAALYSAGPKTYSSDSPTASGASAK